MNKQFPADKMKTALVVIDLQKGITSRPTAPHPAKTVVGNAAQLARVFRQNSLPVFLVKVDLAAGSNVRLRPISDATWAGGAMSPDWSELAAELKAGESDIIITKKQWGAFYGTELDLQLRRRKIENIVLCGISTNIGVESTARFAYEYGYNQIFAEDAMSAMSADEHANSVQKIFPRIGLVRSTAEILSWL